MKSPIFRKVLSCHCCFPQPEGVISHNTESFGLYYWEKESSLSWVLFCINITDDAICGRASKAKRILVIHVACFFIL